MRFRSKRHRKAKNTLRSIRPWQSLGAFFKPIKAYAKAFWPASAKATAPILPAGELSFARWICRYHVADEPVLHQ